MEKWRINGVRDLKKWRTDEKMVRAAFSCRIRQEDVARILLTESP